ncbi:protein-glutamine glutaminase [Chryseobacterium fistulae]|nr:protein-glutamine glutaminase [Chryseobacterium fistulae]
MKNKFLLALICITMLAVTACSESSREMNPALESKTGTYVVEDFGKTIPVSIEKENDHINVGFIYSAQLYTIKLNESNKEFIALLEESVNKESTIHIYLRKNSNEIVKVEKLSDGESKAFRTSLMENQTIRAKRNIYTKNVIENEGKLRSLFIKIKNNSCNGLHPSSPCANFNYGIDGCYARAHKIKQLLEENGYSSEKQWVYGNLRARTLDGKGCISWGYHVAVLVTYINNYNKKVKAVVDPSLFPTKLVSIVEWENACMNRSCGYVHVTSRATTPSWVYYRSQDGRIKTMDINYNKTNCTLSKLRGYSGTQRAPRDLAWCNKLL